MLRRLLLPVLALGLLATEAATAQAAPAPAPAKDARQAYRKAVKAQRVLSKREQQVIDARAKADEAAVRAQAAAASQPTASNTTWSGWNNDPQPFTPETAAPHRATVYNVSSAPGMPLNQLGHGVSTDYNGRPLAPAVANTTLTNVR